MLIRSFKLFFNVQTFFGARQIQEAEKARDMMTQQLMDKNAESVVDNEKKEEDAVDESCPICFSCPADSVIADCGHVVCFACLEAIFLKNEKSGLSKQERKNLGLGDEVVHALCPSCMTTKYSTKHVPVQDGVVVTLQGERVRISGVVKKLFFSVEKKKKCAASGSAAAAKS